MNQYEQTQRRLFLAARRAQKMPEDDRAPLGFATRVLAEVKTRQQSREFDLAVWVLCGRRALWASVMVAVLVSGLLWWNPSSTDWAEEFFFVSPLSLTSPL